MNIITTLKSYQETQRLDPIVFLRLTPQERLHYKIVDHELVLMAGTEIRISVPINETLFQLLRSLRVAISDDLVSRVKPSAAEEDEPLLLLRQGENQAQSIP